MVWCWEQKWDNHGPGAAPLEMAPTFSSCPLSGCPSRKAPFPSLAFKGTLSMLGPCGAGQGWNLLPWAPKGTCLVRFSDLP